MVSALRVASISLSLFSSTPASSSSSSSWMIKFGIINSNKRLTLTSSRWSHLPPLKCSSDHTDGGSVFKNAALSSIVGKKVEELLSREENKEMMDRLNKAVDRVELARRELKEIEKEEMEAKKMREYIEIMESRASEIAGAQKAISEARILNEEAERSLSMFVDEFSPEDTAVTEGSEINRDGERWESVRAASISAIVGTLAGLPISASLVTSGSELLLPLAVTFVSCALFGVTFRYAVRRDLDNIQLKTGTAAAFGLVKGLGTLNGGPALELNINSFTSHAVDGALLAAQNVFIFIFAAVALDFCFKMRLLSPFPMRRSTAKLEIKK
ncbi:hypothetical protein AKJ16_DCAP01158 [Drosera capensis]